MGKRGQLTIFIIIGVLIVLLVGTVLVINARQSKTYSLPRTESVSQEAQPVQDFIMSCLSSVSEQGLRLIGDHGGYLSTEEIPNAKTDRLETTQSDVVYFSPDGNYGIPYWWYLKSDNTCTSNCEFASKRPALHKSEGEPSIEGQLDKYVKANLPNCLKNFEAFEEQQITVVSAGTPVVNSIVTEDDVVVGLTQRFTMTKAGNQNELSQFATSIPVRLNDMYELATNITTLEAENGFLASHARELITAFSRTDPGALPPASDVEFELSPGTRWVKFSVEERVIDLLVNYVPLLQVFGTLNYRPIEPPTEVQNRATVINALNRNALIPQTRPWPDFEAKFVYLPEWKPYFDLNCNGQVCKPESFLSTFQFNIGIQRYNFAYDLSYPAMVELRQPAAMNEQGYTFRFALEGNMRNNEVLTSDWKPAPVSDSFKSLFCDESQRTSGVVNISVHDSVTGKPADATVAYKCGDEACLIGDAINGSLSTRLPRCIGGELSVVKEDYQGEVALFNTNTDAQQIKDLAVHPIVHLNGTGLKLRLKKDMVSWSWALDPTAVALTKFDQMLVTMQRKEGGQNSFANLCGANIDGLLDTDIPLTVGNYSVSISLLYHGNITIPPTRRCGDLQTTYSIDWKKAAGGAVFGQPHRGIEVEQDRDCYFVPENAIYFGNVPPGNTTIGNVTMVLPPVLDKPCTSQKPFPAGNIQFDWEVTPSMLFHASKIKFKAGAMGAEIPGTFLIIEDLEEISNVQKYVDANMKLFYPEVGP